MNFEIHNVLFFVSVSQLASRPRPTPGTGRRWSQSVCATSWKPPFRGCRPTVWTSSTSTPRTTRTPSRTLWGPVMSSTKRCRDQRPDLLWETSVDDTLPFMMQPYRLLYMNSVHVIQCYKLPSGKIQGVWPVELCIMGSGWNRDHLQTQQLDPAHCLSGIVALLKRAL